MLSEKLNTLLSCKHINDLLTKQTYEIIESELETENISINKKLTKKEILLLLNHFFIAFDENNQVNKALHSTIHKTL